MPVLPLVGSTIVPPGLSAPLASAASTMRTAMRSFTDPPGLRYSTLASTSGASGPRERVTLVSRTSGVPPIRSRTDSAYCTGRPPRGGAVWSGTIPSDGSRRGTDESWPPPAFSMVTAQRAQEADMTTVQVTEGHAPVNGVQMYWRSTGEGGTPLIVVHGGFGSVDMWDGLLDRLAERRRVIAVELQGHGHTADIDR